LLLKKANIIPDAPIGDLKGYRVQKWIIRKVPLAVG
jgi:hypothetical protein